MKTLIGLLFVVALIGCSDVGRLTQGEASARKCHPKNFPVCVACCDALFGPGKERGQCVSQAAQGAGSCVVGDCMCRVLDMAVAPPPPQDLSVAPVDLASHE